MITISYTISILLTCTDLDCSGFDCELFQILGTRFQVPICMCDSRKYTYDCSRCRNIRYDAEDQCDTCIQKDRDEREDCSFCKAGKKYDPRDCTKCIDPKYKQGNCDNQCSNTHLDITKDCSDCLGSYVHFKQECISLRQQNFILYFGLVFSHSAAIALIIFLLAANWFKRKHRQQLQLAQFTMIPQNPGDEEPSEFTIIENNGY